MTKPIQYLCFDCYAKIDKPPLCETCQKEVDKIEALDREKAALLEKMELIQAEWESLSERARQEEQAREPRTVKLAEVLAACDRASEEFETWPLWKQELSNPKPKKKLSESLSLKATMEAARKEVANSPSWLKSIYARNEALDQKRQENKRRK